VSARTLSDSAARFIPRDPTWPELREAAAGCTACPLHLTGTQTVFGEGAADAPLMLVGEQPGDKEDLAGKPFVGPSGQLLDECLAAAGIDRARAYVTNTVKHFKWVPRGKIRLHSKPGASEIRACVPWLEAEMALLKPRVITLLGATAAQALLGKEFRVTQQRGQFLQTSFAPYVLATVHPSSLLRAPDEEARRSAIERFVADLRKAASVLS
jgi:uracil-DNA glycosylase